MWKALVTIYNQYGYFRAEKLLQRKERKDLDGVAQRAGFRDFNDARNRFTNATGSSDAENILLAGAVRTCKTPPAEIAVRRFDPEAGIATTKMQKLVWPTIDKAEPVERRSTLEDAKPTDPNPSSGS
jgi:hypothetical protein